MKNARNVGGIPDVIMNLVKMYLMYVHTIMMMYHHDT